MMITNNVTLDLMKPGNPPIIHGVQEDRFTRRLALKLTAQGLDWIIPSDVSVEIAYSRCDGTGGRYDALPDGSAAWTFSGSTLTVVLPPQVLAVSGPVNLWITLRQGEEQLSTFPVVLDVAAGQAAEGGEFAFVSCLVLTDQETGSRSRIRVSGGQLWMGTERILTATDRNTLVQVLPQTLTNGQRLQARTNIGAIGTGELTAEVESALTAAKASGEFDGPQGIQGIRGETGPAGYTPVRGTDYWTEADQAAMVADVLAALPVWEGGSY